MRLVKESQIANRQDLVEAAKRLADFIQDYLDKGEPIPIINIIGSVSAGKSLFWDFVTQKLLGNDAIFLANKSKSLQCRESSQRIYETWTKLSEGKNKNLTLFFCNARSTLSAHNNAELVQLNTGSLSELGDVIILTNGWQDCIPKETPQLELAITVKSKDPTVIFPSQLAYACNF